MVLKVNIGLNYWNKGEHARVCEDLSAGQNSGWFCVKDLQGCDKWVLINNSHNTIVNGKNSLK